MAKTQLNVRVEDEIAERARLAAANRHMSVQDYIEQLVREDTDPLRTVFINRAQDVIDTFGDFIEERASAPRH